MAVVSAEAEHSKLAMTAIANNVIFEKKATTN